jgi:protein-tyrosine-phosphatase/DNA-binding transcriptional ArsR family regulator
MEEKNAILALAALAQEHRLKVFRLLIQRAPHGLPAGHIAAHVGVPASTMSSHLAHLERSGLLRSWREQRRIFYAADTDGIRRLLTFLTEACCGGRPELCGYGGQVADHPTPPVGSMVERTATMPDRVFQVLFLCTGNSARSILAECILNRLGQGTFKAYSAGSTPTGAVHPYALDLLRMHNYPIEHLRSKSWNEFTGPDAPALDFVFTLCDAAANEVCPVWPGQPITAHWGLPDPAAVEGKEAERRFAFADTMRMLTRRIDLFVNLPVAALDRLSLQQQLDTIGTTGRSKE